MGFAQRIRGSYVERSARKRQEKYVNGCKRAYVKAVFTKDMEAAFARRVMKSEDPFAFDKHATARVADAAKIADFIIGLRVEEQQAATKAQLTNHLPLNVKKVLSAIIDNPQADENTVAKVLDTIPTAARLKGRSKDEILLKKAQAFHEIFIALAQVNVEKIKSKSEKELIELVSGKLDELI